MVHCYSTKKNQVQTIHFGLGSGLSPNALSKPWQCGILMIFRKFRLQISTSFGSLPSHFWHLRSLGSSFPQHGPFDFFSNFFSSQKMFSILFSNFNFSNTNETLLTNSTNKNPEQKIPMSKEVLLNGKDQYSSPPCTI
jgi:hypothetical protein